MLSESRKLNPECEDVQAHMRRIRLGRQFDRVLIRILRIPKIWSNTFMRFEIPTVPFEWSTTLMWRASSVGPSGFNCLVTEASRERPIRLSIQKLSGGWTCLLG